MSHNIIVQSDYSELLQSLEPNSVDLILTDPPYTISKDTGFKNVGKKGIDRFAVSMDFGEWDKETIDLNNLSKLSYKCLRKGGSAIIWYDLWKISYLSEAMKGAGFKQIRLIIWEKTNPVPLNQSVNYLTNSREVAVLGVKVGKPTFNGKYHNGVFKYPIPRENRIHPTQKPLKLFTELVEIHSIEEDVIVDPFLGSGTTAIAALSTGRKFFGGDISEEYVRHSIERVKNNVL